MSLRLRADVPVGITLSGGLDSSAVVAAAGGKVKTFSVSFAGAPETDELPYVRRVARYFGTNHHEVTINADEFMNFLPEFVWHTDDPLADLASIPFFHVSRLARQQVKVILSGEGSDEILDGYNFEQLAQRWDDTSAARNTIPSWLRGRVGSLVTRLSPTFATRRQLATMVCDQRLAAEPLTMTNYYSSADKQKLLSGPSNWPDSLDRVRAAVSSRGNAHPLDQTFYVYYQDWLVKNLLMKADRMSMANSLELRTPFLDYRLVEWAASLPPRLKAGRGTDGVYRSKTILRRYAAGRLPQ